MWQVLGAVKVPETLVFKALAVLLCQQMFGKYKKLLVAVVIGTVFCLSTPAFTGLASAAASSHSESHAASSLLLSAPRTFATDSSPTCDTHIGDPLTWILCPIFNGMANMSQWIFNSLLQPFLITAPISVSPSDPSYKVWNQFRLYGNIVLVFGILFIVFSESIGGGVLDAYTVKKMLPRLLVAAILINLSIYIVAFAVDITNIIGSGIGDLLISPLKATGAWNFSVNGFQGIGVFAVGLLGLFLTGGFLVGLGAVLFGSAAGFTSVLFVAMLVILPIVLGLLATFVTLIIRKGLILFLVLVSPIAFALYCLPNTEQYFKRWWKLLLEALLIYPIVIIIFSVGAILSVTILTANSITPGQLGVSQPGVNAAGAAVSLTLGQVTAVIVAFFLQFLPLLAIPFAFRIAGGVLGQVNEFMQKGAQRINSLADNRRNAEKAKMAAAIDIKRYDRSKDLGEIVDASSGLKKRRAQFLRRRVSGYDIGSRLAAHTAEAKKRAEEMIANGPDESARGLAVNKEESLKGKGLHVRLDADGEKVYLDMDTGAVVDEGRIGDYEYQVSEKDGSRTFQTAGGGWVTESDVDEAYRLHGTDEAYKQAVLSYEMRKATTKDQTERLGKVYKSIAKAWGMSDTQASGAWIGSAFENQNLHLEYKYTDWKTGKMTPAKAKAFLTEVFEKRGNYNLSQMTAGTIEKIMEAHEIGDDETKGMARGIAETFMSRYGSGGGIAGMADGDIPIMQPPGPPQPEVEIDLSGDGTSGTTTLDPRAQISTNSPGSGSVQQAVRKLAVLTGVYQPLDPSTDVRSTGPPPTDPRNS